MDALMQRKLEFTAHELPLKRFFLPEGECPFSTRQALQPFERLLFVLSGEKHELMSLKNQIHEVKLTAGDVYLLRKNQWEFQSWKQKHELLCIVPRPGFLRVSYYDVRPAEGVVHPDNISACHHTGLPPSMALLSTFSALRDAEMADGEHLPSLIRAAAQIALRECVRSSGSGGKALSTFNRLCIYLENHFHEEISRDELAARFQLSAGYLSAIFPRMTGRSFGNYLTDCRLDCARKLLRSSNLSIKEVSMHSGFRNDIYFIRRFRELTGETPGAYRLHCQGSHCAD